MTNQLYILWYLSVDITLLVPNIVYTSWILIFNYMSALKKVAQTYNNDIKSWAWVRL